MTILQLVLAYHSGRLHIVSNGYISGDTYFIANGKNGDGDPDKKTLICAFSRVDYWHNTLLNYKSFKLKLKELL